MQETEVLSLSLSFSSYSNGEIAEIAARTVEEFDSEESSGEIDTDERADSAARRDEDDEFEFSVDARDFESLSQTSADEIFQNGKIRPVYSAFNRDSTLGSVKSQNENEKENKINNSVCPKIRLPLRKLFLDERETAITRSSSSSSEGNEIEGVAAVRYCSWPPKAAPAAEEEVQCKKSSSAGGNLKRWKLRDFLHKSNSDGSQKNLVDSKENEKKTSETPSEGGKIKPASPCMLNGGDMQISYLRYGYDLTELFGDVNALRKKLESF